MITREQKEMTTREKLAAIQIMYINWTVTQDYRDTLIKLNK